MTGNRVEELEKKVRELEASVSGLTDELVETKERLRAIEEEVEPELDMDIIEGRPTRSTDETEETESASDDDKSEQTQGTDNTDSEQSDDIIVA